MSALFNIKFSLVMHMLNPHFRSHRNFGNNDEDDFRVVSGILRLSTKYLIDSLRAKALAHLSLAWPSDLRTWDLREDVSRGFEMDGAGNVHRYPHPFVGLSYYLSEIDRNLIYFFMPVCH